MRHYLPIDRYTTRHPLRNLAVVLILCALVMYLEGV